MKHPDVSVIMPNYNGGRYLIDSISSLLKQTFSDWELVIVDECSMDNSWQIIQSYAGSISKIRGVKNAKRLGPGAARNRGLEEVNGRFIAFLDSDDLWPSYRLIEQMEYMKVTDATLCFGDYARIDVAATRVLKKVVVEKEQVEFNDLLGNPMIFIGTLMIDRSKIKNLPRFPENIWRAEDYMFHLELLKLARRAVRIPKLLAHYRTGLASSNSHFGCMREMWWIYSENLKLGRISSIWYFSIYLFNALERRFRNNN